MGDGSPSATRRALAVALPLAMIAGVAFVAMRAQAPAPSPAMREPTTDAGQAAATPPPATAAAPAEAEPDTAVETATAAPEPAPAPAAGSAAGAPAFDVVRVEPDGSAAVAGTAEPGSKVTIFADQAPLAEAKADAQGNFVAVFKVEPSEAPRALTLGATPAEGGEARPSDEVVMLLPRAPETPAPAATAAPSEAATAEPTPAPQAAATSAPEPTATATPAPVAEATAPEAGVPAPEAASAGAAPEVAVTAIVRADAVEVLPAPSGSQKLTLASISYTDTGGVTLAGVGPAGMTLRAYVDDRLAQEGRVAANGRWALDLPDVAEGLYTLRIDQLAADGKVARRVETPFQRDYPHPPPPRPGQPAGPVGTVTVQPGNNLWTLARERYGSGVMYTQIFTANREQIRNPDLIYPGQIFNMPEGAPEAPASTVE